MPEFLYDLHPVAHITADAVGVPGQRTFYLQAEGDGQVVTLIAEKEQVRMLAESVEQLLGELVENGVAPARIEDEPGAAEMALRKPLDPLFRIAQLGLGYDQEDDLVVLVASQAAPAEEEEEEIEDELLRPQRQEQEPEEPQLWVRFWATRAQMQALSKQGARACAGGRPLCPQCLQPMDAGGHFCVKKNGHAGAH